MPYLPPTDRSIFLTYVCRVTVLLLIAAVISGLPFSPVPPVRGGSFDAGNLVSNATFTAKDTMSAAEIQAFLVSKGSVLALVDSGKLGEGANGRSAAQIIYDATRGSRTDFALSNGYGPSNPLVISLNPQVILITLQKEQSLITGTYDPGSAITQNALNKALGMGCPDGSGCNPAYAGFTNQITYAAAQLMRNYYQANNSAYKVGSTYTFTNTTGPPYYAPASQSVTIGNAATSSLYQYTPHVYNGNYNFWRFMDIWFAPTFFHPTLRYNLDDGTLYAIDSGVRLPVTGRGYAQWGFAGLAIGTMSAEEKALPVGSLLTHLALDSDGSVYFMDNGYKRAFTSVRIFERSGMSWADVSPVSSSILNQVPTGLPMYETLRPTSGDGTVYLATNGNLLPISGDMFFNVWTFDEREVGVVPGYVTANLPVGPLLTRFALVAGGDGTVFVIDRGNAYPLSGAVARAWQFNLSSLSTVGLSVIYNYRNGGLLTTLATQAGGDGTVYLIQNGQKLPLTAAAWRRRGYQWAEVRTLSAGLLNLVPTGPIQR